MRVRHHTIDLRVVSVLAVAVGVAFVLVVLALRPTDPPPVDGGAAVPREQVGPERQTAAGRYVALGDWWAAGPGLEGATAEDRACRRAPWSYPEVVAEELGLDLLHRACAGASPEAAGLGGRAADGRQLPPQVASLSDDTDVVTLSVGAEAPGLLVRTTSLCLRLAAGAPTGSPCRDAFGASGLETVRAAAGVMAQQVEALLTEVVRRAPRADVLFVGYVNFFATDAGCFARSDVAEGDVGYLREAMGLVVESVRTAAEAAGATYVDPTGLFTGHLICSREPYVVREPRAGGPGFALTRSGHEALASAVVGAAAADRRQ